jgi:S1-C subfamily serine protease
VVLLVWLVGGMIGAGMAPWIGPSVRDSVALRLTDALLPPPLIVAGRLLGLLDSTDLPPLFGGLEPIPAAPVDLPADAETQALARSAIASTARIAASGCGPGTSVGSGFFIGPAHVVTNAHVVAGSEATTVSVSGATFDAVVVAFDAAADLALLHASGAAVPSLELLATTPGRGSTGAILGYPGGGPLTVTAGAITATHDVVGPDIYGQGGGDRSVVELRAAIRRGNSGGPLVVEPGVVGAVVFGASRLDSDVGYAIGSDQALERLGPFIGATAAVGTGSCL